MNERIEVQATPGLTVYAVVRDDQARPWNGGTFEAYEDAHLASYAVPLAEEGTSGFYSGNFPPSIPPGTYAVVAYAQSGGTPAPDDTPLAQADISRATQVGLVVNLTSLEYVKQALQIKDTSLDAYLTQVITDVSQMVQDYLGGRQLAAADHVEQHEGGDGYVRVLHPPINSLSSVTLDVGTPSPRTLDADQFRYNVTTGEIRLGTGSIYGGNLGACGTSVSVSYNGGFSPIPGGVQRAVALIIGRLLRTYSSTSANVSSKAAGDVSVSYFNPSLVDLTDPLFGDAAHLLRHYRASMRY